MSSLRVTSHNRAHGDQPAEASRGDAPANGGGFAAALGTAAAGTKGSDAAPPGGGGDGSEGGNARKRADGSGNGADAAAILAASAPPVVAALPVSASPSGAPDTQAAGDKSAAVGALAVPDALNPTATAGVIDPAPAVGIAASDVPSRLPRPLPHPRCRLEPPCPRGARAQRRQASPPTAQLPRCSSPPILPRRRVISSRARSTPMAHPRPRRRRIVPRGQWEMRRPQPRSRTRSRPPHSPPAPARNRRRISMLPRRDCRFRPASRRPERAIWVPGSAAVTVTPTALHRPPA